VLVEGVEVLEPGLRELVVFAHGMANFAHNRDTKAAQEDLIRAALADRHQFLGTFEDSGNFAFVTAAVRHQLETDVMRALNTRYRVQGVVTVERARLADELAALEELAKAKYGEQFRTSDYGVETRSGRWRLGLVFIKSGGATDADRGGEGLRHEGLKDGQVEVLRAHGGIVGVLKFDPKRPRIPWGVPARIVSDTMNATIATARSARTVRGVLRKYLEMRK
jgi:hypothetical protein